MLFVSFCGYILFACRLFSENYKNGADILDRVSPLAN